MSLPRFPFSPIVSAHHHPPRGCLTPSFGLFGVAIKFSVDPAQEREVYLGGYDGLTSTIYTRFLVCSRRVKRSWGRLGARHTWNKNPKRRRRGRDGETAPRGFSQSAGCAGAKMHSPSRYPDLPLVLGIFPPKATGANTR